MYKEIIDTRLVAKIGEYGIVRSKEGLRLDNGTLCSTSIWYDVCLDHGDGDIIYSCKKLDEAKQYASKGV